jgi:hypothetical protein
MSSDTGSIRPSAPIEWANGVDGAARVVPRCAVDACSLPRARLRPESKGRDARQDVLQSNSHRGHLLNQWAEFGTAGTREVGEAYAAESEPFAHLIRPSCLMESAKLS